MGIEDSAGHESAGSGVMIRLVVEPTAKNAAAVFTCTLTLAGALAEEQFLTGSRDITSPSAQLAAGTLTEQSHHQYSDRMPSAPVMPYKVIRVIDTRGPVRGPILSESQMTSDDVSDAVEPDPT